MNNILSFNEYNGQELERIVYDDILNEKSSLNSGIRGFFNKRASRQVRSELSEEIEMSKAIMEGIQKGLETLNENFDIIKKNIADAENDNKKGEKQKALDEIIKILETSRKNTWDINELIDEGEIDYTGFTANVGIASIAYFGILLTPFRAAVMIHKGYNYFFNIVKNTIRKALVMLQLNFDQFENLIITKGFQSADWVHAVDTNEKITEFYMQLETELVGKGGIIKGKQAEKIKNKLQLARDKAKQIREGDKIAQQNENALNCLDQYNNTYTRSLETLKQYSQDDVQKQLDAIKTSMTKLAGQEADLQTYAELIIAAAEEHAYKVSSSIYNKFAKMTEVFSLPNQQKLIDLIQEANKEQVSMAKKERKEKKAADELQKKLESESQIENDGLEVFNTLDGVKIGKMDEETKRFDSSEIEADGWTYSEFEKLDEDQQSAFETWLALHPEVLAKCARTLRVAIYSPYNEAYHEYVDSLVDYIGPCIEETINDSYHILNFDEFVINESEKKSKNKDDEKKKEVKTKIDDSKGNYSSFKELMFGSKTYKFTDDDLDDLEYCVSILTKDADYTGDDKYDELVKSLESTIEKIKNRGKKVVKIDFSEISTSQAKDLKLMYVEDKDGNDMTKIAVTAFKVIGDRLLKDKTFVKNAEDIVEIIKKCLTEKVVKVSPVTYKIFSESIAKLKELRDNDYFNAEDESKDSAKKSEK